MDKLRCGLITLEPRTGGLITPVADGFLQNGCDVQVLHRDMDWDLTAYDFLVTYGPMQSMVWAIHRLSQCDCLPPVAVWYTEQVPSPQPSLFVSYGARARYFLERSIFRSPGLGKMLETPRVAELFQRAGRMRALGEILALKSAGLLRIVGTLSETNAHFFRFYGLPADVIPIGYHPYFGRRMADSERDIDVAFLGSTRDQRRSQIIADLEQKLRKQGISFVIKDGSPERGYVFGRARSQLLNRTKIMLNIMRQSWDDPVFRMLLAAPAGAMLISESLLPTSTGPFDPGTHFAMADLNTLTDAIREYLDDEQRRSQITRQAYDYVTGHMTMQQMARKVMAHLER